MWYRISTVSYMLSILCHSMLFFSVLLFSYDPIFKYVTSKYAMFYGMVLC